MLPKTKNLLQVNLAVLIWGGTAMFAKGISGLPVVKIICLRSFVGALALLGFLLALRVPIRMKRRRHWGIMALLGVLLCGHWLTYFLALRVSSAAVAILALHTYVIFTALIEPFLFKEKFKKSHLITAAAVLAGILIMTPRLSLSDSTTMGIVYGIISGLFWLTRNLLSRKFVKQYTSTTLMFWQMTVTGLILVPWLFTAGGEFTLRNIGLLVLLGAAFTALPQALFSAGLNNLSARTVGMFNTLLAVYGAALGWFFYRETITPRTAIGGLIIMACILWETIREARE